MSIVQLIKVYILEELSPTTYVKIFQDPPRGIQVERDKMNK